jgi:hypothetical protein
MAWINDGDAWTVLMLTLILLLMAGLAMFGWLLLRKPDQQSGLAPGRRLGTQQPRSWQGPGPGPADMLRILDERLAGAEPDRGDHRRRVLTGDNSVPVAHQ